MGNRLFCCLINEDDDFSLPTSVRPLNGFEQFSRVPILDDEDELTVHIEVPPGPMGLRLAEAKKGIVVEGFILLPDNTKGVLELSGEIQKGSTLCAINKVDVTQMPLENVIQVLRCTSHIPRNLTFRLPMTYDDADL